MASTLKKSNEKAAIKKSATLGSRLAIPYLILFCWLGLLITPIVFVLWHYQMLNSQQEQILKPQIELKLKLNQLNNERRQLIYQVLEPLDASTNVIKIDNQQRQLNANWQALAHQLDVLVQFNHNHFNGHQSTPQLPTLDQDKLTKLKINQLHHAAQIQERLNQAAGLLRQVQSNEPSDVEANSSQAQQLKASDISELISAFALPLNQATELELNILIAQYSQILAAQDSSRAASFNAHFAGEQGVFNLAKRHAKTITDIAELVNYHQQQIESMVFLHTHKMGVQLPVPWQSLPYVDQIVSWINLDKQVIDNLLLDDYLVTQFVILCLALILLSFIGFGLHFNHKLEKSTAFIIKQVKDFSKGKPLKISKTKVPFHEANVVLSYLTAAASPQQNNWKLKEKLKALKKHHQYVEQTAGIASFVWSNTNKIMAEPHLLAMLHLNEVEFHKAGEHHFKTYLDRKTYKQIKHGFMALLSGKKEHFNIVIQWANDPEQKRKIAYLLTARLVNKDHREIIGALRNWHEEQQLDNQIQQLKNHLHNQTSRFSKRLARYNQELLVKVDNVHKTQAQKLNSLLLSQQEVPNEPEHKVHALALLPDLSPVANISQQQLQTVSGLSSDQAISPADITAELETLMLNLRDELVDCQMTLFVEPQIPQQLVFDCHHLKQLIKLLATTSCNHPQKLAIVITEKSLKGEHKSLNVDVFWAQQSTPNLWSGSWAELLDDKGLLVLNDTEQVYLKALVKQLRIKLSQVDGLKVLSHQVPLDFSSDYNQREQFELPVELDENSTVESIEHIVQHQLVVLTESKLTAGLWQASCSTSAWQAQQVSHFDELKKLLAPNIFANAPIEAIVLTPSQFNELEADLNELTEQLPKSNRPMLFVSQQGACAIEGSDVYESISLIEHIAPALTLLNQQYQQKTTKPSTKLENDISSCTPSVFVIRALVIMPLTEKSRRLLATLTSLNVSVDLITNPSQVSQLSSRHQYTLVLTSMPIDLNELYPETSKESSKQAPQIVLLDEEVQTAPAEGFNTTALNDISRDALYSVIKPQLILPQLIAPAQKTSENTKSNINNEVLSEQDNLNIQAWLGNLTALELEPEQELDLEQELDGLESLLDDSEDNNNDVNLPFNLQTFTQHNGGIELSCLLLDEYAEQLKQLSHKLNRSFELEQLQNLPAILANMEAIARELGMQKLMLQCQQLQKSLAKDENKALDAMVSLLNTQLARIDNLMNTL